MTAQHGMMLRGYVDELLKATLQEVISRERAIECCRSLVNLTINDAIVNARRSSEPKRDLGDSAGEPRVSEDSDRRLDSCRCSVKNEAKRSASTAAYFRRWCYAHPLDRGDFAGATGGARHDRNAFSQAIPHANQQVAWGAGRRIAKSP